MQKCIYTKINTMHIAAFVEKTKQTKKHTTKNHHHQQQKLVEITQITMELEVLCI